ncbi:Hypothetical protein FKW44_017969 [Caligus rogercresseyi]|uniref:Uncharacterized protein n=1 Tax=Caligus rogercresseyi TaxID=217165 RepID=A0A7T8GTS1_CALRO|nr:Hypothetical protein FKW44_017969 [Caligus rogercresseyi]
MSSHIAPPRGYSGTGIPLTTNNSSRQPKSNPNITPKQVLSTLNSWPSHLPL